MEEKNTVPVWGGNFSPFRLIALEGDEWTATIDEINSMSYDSTKLFRSSFSIDVGIAPLSIIILFDGTLVLPRCSDIPKSRALAIFNHHLTDLLLGGFFLKEISPDDVTAGSMNFWGYHRHHCPSGLNARLSQSLRTHRADPDDAIRLIDPLIVSKEDYLSHYASGSELSGKLPDNFSSVFLPACTAFCSEEWERALILGWSSVELLISQIWMQNVISNTRVAGIKDNKRKDFLKDIRTWTSSTRIELLWQKGSLTDELYALLDLARSARNTFIHKAKPCDPQDSRASIKATLLLIETIASINSISFDGGTIMHRLDESTEPFRSPISDEHGRMIEEPKFWRYPDPAPGFEDWGDRPFEKIPEIELKPLKKDV